MVDFFNRKAKAAREAARKQGHYVALTGSDARVVSKPIRVDLTQAGIRQAVTDKQRAEDAQRFVTFMGRSSAEEVTDRNVAIISISGKYDSNANISNDVPKLFMSFGTTGNDFDKQFDEVDYKAIMTFVDSHPDKNIIVHCGEGRMRSVAIAMGLEHAYDMRLKRDYPGCPGSCGMMDKGIYRAFVGYTFEAQVEAEQA